MDPPPPSVLPSNIYADCAPEFINCFPAFSPFTFKLHPTPSFIKNRVYGHEDYHRRWMKIESWRTKQLVILLKLSMVKKKTRPYGSGCK